MIKSKTIRKKLNMTNTDMYNRCADEAFRIVQKHGLVKKSPIGTLVRFSATGQPSWRCSMYNHDLLTSGLCENDIVSEFVYNYLKENYYEPTPSAWRGNANASANLLKENLEKAKLRIHKEKSAIVIQKTFRDYFRRKLDRLVRILQRKWRFKQIRRMRSFYLEPTPHTDSMPYLFHPRHKLYKRKPSFGMIYFRFGHNIVTKDMDTKGGPTGIHRTSWYLDLDSECIYWTYKVSRSVFEVRKWTYGKDFTVKITRDVDRFRGILRNLRLNR